MRVAASVARRAFHPSWQSERVSKVQGSPKAVSFRGARAHKTTSSDTWVASKATFEDCGGEHGFLAGYLQVQVEDPCGDRLGRRMRLREGIRLCFCVCKLVPVWLRLHTLKGGALVGLRRLLRRAGVSGTTHWPCNCNAGGTFRCLLCFCTPSCAWCLGLCQTLRLLACL